MKIPKNAFLVYAVVSFFDFITLFTDKNNTHEFFIWEINIWLYRIYKLLISLIFLKLFLEKHNDRLDKIESKQC